MVAAHLIVTYCPCLNCSPGRDRSRFETKIWSSAQESEQVVIFISKYLSQRKLTSVQSMWRPLTSFGGNCDDGHDGRGGVSRRLRARTARISVRYHPTSSSNSESSGFSQRGEQMVGNGGKLLTARRSWQISGLLGAQIWWASIKQF